jgi:hypothetical protein
MRETPWTPGPWTVESHTEEVWGKPTTAVYGVLIGGIVYGPDEDFLAEANPADSYLIAAAPEMADEIARFAEPSSFITEGDRIRLRALRDRIRGEA